MFENFGLILFFGTAIIGAFMIFGFKKSSRDSSQRKESFWDRERRANVSRRKDISSLNYISIPLNQLPFIDTDDDEILEYHKSINRLATMKILNLTGITNTELKEQYGVANLTELTDYDNNYTTLVNTIARWGARLIELEYIDEAVTVLEYGLSVGTDVSRNYLLLADIYRTRGEYDRIDALITRATTLKSLMKNSILTKLNEIRESITG
jgi:hypothetical protein